MNLKTTPAGVLFCIASLLAVPALPAADDDSLGIAGRWTPDASANRWLTMPPAAEGKEAGSTGSNGRGGPPGMGGRSGDGPPGGGGGQGGQPPGGGGGRPGGGPPGAGGPPPGGGGASRPDIELEAARLAAPPFEDLLLVAEGGKLLIGGDAQIQIPLNGTRVLLADGSTQASLFTENGDYVLEFDAGDGFKVSHTYRLEGGGKRLRVISVTQHPSLWKPQETQKLYRRTPDAEPVPPAPAS